MINGNLKYEDIVRIVASILREFDGECPVHKKFKPGIGPYGEPQIVKIIADKLSQRGIFARTKRCPDLAIENEWAIEFKIVRPFGDNDREAENWSVNMLHPYSGNTSLIGDAIKLVELSDYKSKGLFLLGYEHNPAIINLDPLICSFEVLMKEILKINLGPRIEVCEKGLVHPVHQVLRCIGWEL